MVQHPPRPSYIFGLIIFIFYLKDNQLVIPYHLISSRMKNYCWHIHWIVICDIRLFSAWHRHPFFIFKCSQSLFIFIACILIIFVSIMIFWYEQGIPTPPGKSLKVLDLFPGPGKSWKVSLVLESPGIYLWLNLTNMPFMYRTLCVNKCMKYSCNVLTKRFQSLQLVMNVLWWIVLSHCIYRVSNCCFSVI